MAARTTLAARLRASGLIAGVVLTLGFALAGKAEAAQIRLCAGPGMQPPCVALTHGLTDLRQADLGAPVASFTDTLQGALADVNRAQQVSGALAAAFERGEPGADLAKVMVASQQSQLAFRATVEVRNRLVQAYQDVMNMPL